MTAIWLSYLKTAVRGLLRRRLFTVINVAGLAIGMACSLLMLLYVRHETSYEGFNEHRDRVYRVVRQGSLHVPTAMAQLIRDEFPQIESTARASKPYRPLIGRGSVVAFQSLVMADASLFRLLGIPFVRGAASERPYTIALSTEAAREYFGDEDPIGQTLRWDTSFDLEVTGVYDLPENTHFPYRLVGSYSTKALEPWNVDPAAWGGSHTNGYIYLMAREPGGVADFGERVSHTMGRTFDWLVEEWESQEDGLPRLQRLVDIHLHSRETGEMAPNGRLTSVVLLGSIGAFVLFIACVNFVSLSTARSSERVKEVGLRKVIGARRAQLAGQFLCESALQVAIAAALAVQLALAAAAYLEGEGGWAPQIETRQMWWLVAGLMGVAALGAAYPAAVLAGFEPAKVIRDASKGGVLGVLLRRRLVEFQFALSILLVVGAAVVYLQFRFLQESDIGFEHERTIVFNVGYPEVNKRSGEMVRRMRELPAIEGVTRFHRPPFAPFGDGSAGPVRIGASRAEEGAPTRMPVLSVDAAFVPLMGMDLVAGRNVRDDLGPGQLEALLNESAAAALGYEDARQALGETVDLRWRGRGPIVGVVRDFHYQSLHHRVGPVLLRAPRWVRFPGDTTDTVYYSLVAVKPRAGGVQEGIAQAEAVWRQFASAYPFSYSFLDESFERQYRDEERLAWLLTWLSGLAVFVAALGVFALAAFTVQQRTREIGVRKVLGASARGVLLLFGRDFGRLFLVGAVVAWPLAYWAARSWLERFAYRIEPGPTLFLGATGVVLLVTAVAISHQVARAATANPVEALKCV